LAVTSSENGSRISLSDFDAADALNRVACAGCHTTESNTAFVHVGERYNGTGRAQISKFLQDQLHVRASHLLQVSIGRLSLPLRQAMKPVH
jgi:hypothetical protein